ncbi:MAG: 30S processome protein Utp24 [Desulfurococcaceae archaeon]
MLKTSTESTRKPIVVLDTNMLMLAASGVRVFEQIEEQLETKPRFVVLSPVLNELIKLSRTSAQSLRKQALLALELVRMFCEIVDYGNVETSSVDELIIRYAVENKAIVATNDRELRAKLRAIGIPEAYFREESRRVVVEGYF